MRRLIKTLQLLAHERLAKSILSLIGLTLGAVVLWDAPAYAAYPPLNPSINSVGPPAINRAPAAVVDEITKNCSPTSSGGDGFGAAQTEWVSPAGQPDQNAISIPYGTPYVDLQLNFLTYRCKLTAPTSTVAGHFHIDNVGVDFNGVPSGPSGNNVVAALLNYVDGLPYVATNTINFMTGSYATFSPTPPTFRLFAPSPAGFILSGTTNINLITRGTITRETNGATSYGCALQNSTDNPGTPTGEFDFSKCTPGPSVFSVKINVGPAPTTLQPLLNNNSGLVDGGFIRAGIPYTFYTLASNLTDITSQSFNLAFTNDRPAILSSGAAGGNQFSGPMAGNTSETLPPGGYAVMVNPATPNGTSICFSATIIIPAGSPDSAVNNPDKACYTVQREYSPGVVGLGSDVHAGGGVCDANGNLAVAPPPGSGNVIGNPKGSQFYAEYVTSASLQRTEFGTNGAQANTSAAIGGNGNYLTICRPDLVLRASTPSETTGAQLVPAGSVSFDVTNKSGLWIAGPGSPVLNIRGTINNKLTLFVSGRAVIDNNIVTAPGATLGRDSRSFGLIVKGDVTFAPIVTQADAYIFSNGNINTCLPNKSPECANTLNVNGFMMANSFTLNRFGPISGSSGSTVGEHVQMTPQLYLNPPRLFERFGGSSNNLQSQGERPPLN